MRNIGVLVLFILSVLMVTSSLTAQARHADFITIAPKPLAASPGVNSGVDDGPSAGVPGAIGDKTKPKKHHKSDGGSEEEEDVAIPVHVF